MNIDKFGHHIHKRMRLSELVNFSDTLTKSEVGDFDIKKNRLRGLNLPLDPDEAVNKQYVDEIVNRNDNLLTKTEAGHFDVKQNRLRGLNLPVDQDEAVNKQYVDQKCQNIFNKEELHNMMQLFLEAKKDEIIRAINITIKTKLTSLLSQLDDRYYTKADVDTFFKNIKQK